jgi:hypothetical protein
LLLAEGGVNFVRLDAECWIALFIQILLFGAVTHHSGMADLVRRAGNADGWLVGHVNFLLC